MCLYRKLLLLLICSCAYSGNMLAQTDEYAVAEMPYTPKAPEAYAFAQYLSYPVSLYTGVPNISIPLYEINVGGFSLPISLSYHASGIRVSQEATRVGLGWNLNAGGVISRTVKCADDFQEHANPNGTYNGYFSAPEAIPNNYNQFVEGSLFVPKHLYGDSEPDVFYYSLPGNAGGGKFYLKKDSVPVLFEIGGNPKIQLTNIANSVKPCFEVTACDGTKYYFHDWEETRTASWNDSSSGMGTGTMKDVCTPLEISSHFQSDMQYTSGWYLSDVVTSRQDTIHFNYTQESYQLPVQESRDKMFILSMYVYGEGTSDPLYPNPYHSSKSLMESPRLTEITWKGGRVVFDYSDREDILEYNVGSYPSRKPKKLDGFSVYNSLDSLVKSYDFTYSYFGSNNPETNYTHLYRRLKLDKLTDCLQDSTSYSFYYDGAGDRWPAKNSRNTDYWGYYNGSNNSIEYYCPVVIEDTLLQGGNRNPNFDYMTYGLLNKIKQPTGGEVKFTYEPNKGLDTNTAPIVYTSTNYVKTYRGIYDDNYSENPSTVTDTLVLSKPTQIGITMYFEDVGPYIHSPYFPYDEIGYSAFILYKQNENGGRSIVRCFPVPSSFINHTYITTPKENVNLDAGTYYIEGIAQIDNVYSELEYEYQDWYEDTRIVDTGGFRIAKIESDKTIEYTYDDAVLITEPVYAYKSKVVRSGYSASGEFTTSIIEYLIQTSESAVPLGSMHNDNIYGYGKVTEHFSDGSRKEYQYFNTEEETPENITIPRTINFTNGLIDEIHTYEPDSSCSSREVYYYNWRTSDYIHGFYHQALGGDTAYYYSISMQWPYLSGKHVNHYERNQSRFTEYQYTLNNYFQQTSEKMICDSVIYERKTTYPTDYSGGIYSTMLQRYMIGLPVESYMLKNNSVIKGIKTDYGERNGLIVPVMKYTLDIPEPISEANQSSYYQEKLSLPFYDQYGNPTQQTYLSQNKVLLWGYHGMYLIAEIQNATYGQVTQIHGSNFIENVTAKAVPSASDMASIRNLQNLLPNVLVSTYTYQPLVGVVTMTEATGKTTYYSYDSGGRLVEKYLMENSQKSLLQRYQYHFAPQY